MINKIHNGDVLDVMAKIPSSSVDCVITSPPYWQLRDYGYPEQWGLEPTYSEYLDHLWAMMDQIWRVLKDSGTAWINLGDTYGGFSGQMSAPTKWKNAGSHNFKRTKQTDNKCLLLIPHRFAIGCIDRGWIMRNDIIWAKRNAMPESVRDRFSKKHEHFFFMAKQPSYYFDLVGIRDKATPLNRWGGDTLKATGKSMWDEGTGQETYRDRNLQPNNGMKNPGDVADFWNIPTQSNSKKHYASFNAKLIEKPIIAGSSEFVCIKCGKPREKIIEIKTTKAKREDFGEQASGNAMQSSSGWKPPKVEVTGLTDCDCDSEFQGGIILDPFCGTGTTLVRALQLGRRIIGIDGSKEYCDIATKHINTELNQLKIQF